MPFFILQIVIIYLVSYAGAFWWSTPTSTEPTPILKQVPVGYFRTYTYQPLAYSQRYAPYPPFTGPNYPYEDGSINWNIPALPVNTAKSQQTSTTPSTTTSTTTSTPQYRPSTPQGLQGPLPENSQRLNTFPSSNSLEQQSGASFLHSNIPNYPQISINPELANYQYLSGSVPPQIQFVPCMCPVTVSIGSKDTVENRAVTERDNFLQRDGSETASLLND